MIHSEYLAPYRAGEIGVLGATEFTFLAEYELRRAWRDGEFVSLLWFRVDRRGPMPVDDAKVDGGELRALGELVAVELRASDVVAIVEDRDLAVLLPNTDAEQVTTVLQHLHATVLELAQTSRSGLVARAGRSTLAPNDADRELQRLIAEAVQGVAWLSLEMQSDIT